MQHCTLDDGIKLSDHDADVAMGDDDDLASKHTCIYASTMMLYRAAMNGGQVILEEMPLGALQKL